MPIIIIKDTDEPERLEIGGSVLVYTRATGDEVERELAESQDPRTGERDVVAAGSALLLRHLVGWEGLTDAAGNEIPFSRDLVETVVRGLPYAVRTRLDAAIISGWREASASGKDSASGSSGTA